MEYVFLHEEIESILLFATAPIYLTIVGILQSKNLKTLALLKNKKISKDSVMLLSKKLKRLKYVTPLLMLIGLVVHLILYFLFRMEHFRYGYLISICIMYTIYTLIALINFWIKGSGILKNIKPFQGLPGN